MFFLWLESVQVVEHLGFKASERDHLFQVKQTHHQVSEALPPRYSLLLCVASECWL